MDFWAWVLIVLALIALVTYYYIKEIRKRDMPIWKSTREYLKNIIDIVSGG